MVLIPLVSVRRTEQENRFPLVASIDSEIVLVNSDNGMPWINLTHPNQTEIGEIRLTIQVAFRELGQLSAVPIAVECDPQHLVMQQ
jgi:hypothetical protein